MVLQLHQAFLPYDFVQKSVIYRRTSNVMLSFSYGHSSKLCRFILSQVASLLRIQMMVSNQPAERCFDGRIKGNTEENPMEIHVRREISLVILFFDIDCQQNRNEHVEKGRIFESFEFLEKVPAVIRNLIFACRCCIYYSLVS